MSKKPLILAAIHAGQPREDVAAELGVSEAYVQIVAWENGLKANSRLKAKTAALKQAIRDGYAANRPAREIAEAFEVSIAEVRVYACKMGLTKGRRDAGIHRRGYIVPPDLMPRYKELRRLGLTFSECGYELKLLERSAVSRAA